MLGRLEMEVTDCMRAYEDLMEVVFRHKLSSGYSSRANLKPMYSSDVLMAAIEEVIEGCGLEKAAKFNGETMNGCKV